MNEKKKVTLLPADRSVLFDVIALAVISALCFLLPFAQYSHRNSMYGFAGYLFLTGAKIMNGTVSVSPVPMLYISLVLNILTICIAIAFKKMKGKTGGILLLFAGILQMGFAVLSATQMTNVMQGAKKVEPAFGLTALAMLGLLIIIRAAHILYRNRSLNALDFMILPGALYLLINNYFPMAGLFIAFKNIDYRVGILRSPWCGLDNFRFLFKSVDAWLITKNTLLYNGAFIVIGNIVGIAVGLCLANLLSKRLLKTYQTSILLPQLISYVIVAYIGLAFLSNEAGYITKTFFGDKVVNFYTNKKFWPFALIGINTWKGLGYSSIIYMSSIISIDRNLYEASSLDGANKVQQLFHVTLPMLKSTIITLLIMQIGRIFYSDFGLFYQVPMNSGMLFEVTQTIDTYVYRMLTQLNRIGMASAAGFYQSMVGLTMVLTANWIVRKFDPDNAMF
jgi:ABC-type polysaccharide transport system permease subunit